jgi:DNA invertase Pin-like site-specific DNA recombinase
MNGKGLIEAVAYYRTSSAANVGADKDSEKRQADAVSKFAKANGYAIVDEFYDAAVSGADHVHERKGFASMLARIEGNGVRVVLVETASRFARDILVQETGWRFLKDRGVDLIAVDSPAAFIDDTPTSKMIRQLLGVISEFEKASTVAKLAGARRRKRLATGQKVEGRKSLAELAPEAVALAKKLRRYPVNGHKRSLNEVAAELEAQGYVTRKGTRYGGGAVARMVGEAVS